MAISSFDTLDISKRLKGAGFNEAQAETITAVIRDTRVADLNQLATKADIERLEAKLEAQEAKLEARLEILRRDMTIRLGGMIVIATGVLLAAKFFG